MTESDPLRPFKWCWNLRFGAKLSPKIAPFPPKSSRRLPPFYSELALPRFPSPFRFQMGDFSAPSFSLGLDLDLADLPTEGEEEEEEQERSPLPNPLSGIESPNLELFRDQRLEEREAIGPGIALDPEPIWGTPLPALKRLRRGPPPPRCRSNSLVAHSSLDDGGGELRDDSILLDDDIEEFSSPENNPSRGNQRPS